MGQQQKTFFRKKTTSLELLSLGQRGDCRSGTLARKTKSSHETESSDGNVVGGLYCVVLSTLLCVVLFSRTRTRERSSRTTSCGSLPTATSSCRAPSARVRRSLRSC